MEGWEFKAVLLVDPTTGEPYKAGSSGPGGGAGDASATNQVAGNASLTSIDGKPPALGGGAVPVAGAFWPATQPVSAAALPLPTGAATEATLPLVDERETG